MRAYLVAGIETSTGRKVLSFISDRDAENEHAAEVFVLAGPPRSAGGARRLRTSSAEPPEGRRSLATV
jgi:hypothetical protein